METNLTPLRYIVTIVGNEYYVMEYIGKQPVRKEYGLDNNGDDSYHEDLQTWNDKHLNAFKRAYHTLPIHAKYWHSMGYKTFDANDLVFYINTVRNAADTNVVNYAMPFPNVLKPVSDEEPKTIWSEAVGLAAKHVNNNNPAIVICTSKEVAVQEQMSNWHKQFMAYLIEHYYLLPKNIR